MYDHYTKCPNCGVEIDSDTLVCPYCNFVLADAAELKKLDESIVELEKSFADLSKVTNLSTGDIILLILTAFFWLLALLGVVVMIWVALPLTVLVLLDKQARYFIFNYFRVKRRHKNYINRFSALYPHNKRLQELREEYNKRSQSKIVTFTKKWKWLFAAFVLVLLAPFLVALISMLVKNTSKDNIWYLSDTTYIFLPEKMQVDIPQGYSVLNSSFFVEANGVKTDSGQFIVYNTHDILVLATEEADDTLALEVLYSVYPDTSALVFTSKPVLPQRGKITRIPLDTVILNADKTQWKTRMLGKLNSVTIRTIK